ncbi:MAG: hypothetical protein ACYDHD_02270 [Vulcanimicrobiaceae bacterium]
MRIIAFLLISLSSTRIALAAFPHGPLAYHIANQSVFGLRLGMSPQEAVQIAIRSHLLDPKSTFYSMTKQPCESERAKLIRSGRLAAGGLAPRQFSTNEGAAFKCISRISQENYHGDSLRLHFIEDFPTRPGKMKLVSIHMDLATPTLTMERALYRHAVHKFGHPTFYQSDVGLGSGISSPEERADVPAAPTYASGFTLMWDSSPCWNLNIIVNLDNCNVPFVRPFGGEFNAGINRYYARVDIAHTSSIALVSGVYYTRVTKAILKFENGLKSGNTSF